MRYALIGLMFIGVLVMLVWAVLDDSLWRIALNGVLLVYCVFWFQWERRRADRE